MSIKTEQLKNVIDAAALTVTAQHLMRNGEEWVVATEHTFDATALPDHIRDHVTAYGIKAFLGDRTSDFRKLGIPAAMEAMTDLWALMEAGQLSKPRQAGGGVDRALIHLVANLKGESLIWAEAQLKALPKESRQAIAEKHAKELAKVRAELATANEGDLTDLL